MLLNVLTSNTCFFYVYLLISEKEFLRLWNLYAICLLYGIIVIAFSLMFFYVSNYSKGVRHFYRYYDAFCYAWDQWYNPRDYRRDFTHWYIVYRIRYYFLISNQFTRKIYFFLILTWTFGWWLFLYPIDYYSYKFDSYFYLRSLGNVGGDVKKRLKYFYSWKFLVNLVLLPLVFITFYLGGALFTTLWDWCISGLAYNNYADSEVNYINSRVWFTHEELFEGTIHTEEERRGVQLGLISEQGYERPILQSSYGRVDPTHVTSVHAFPGYTVLTDDLDELVEVWYEVHKPVSRFWYSRQSFRTLCKLVYKGAVRKTHKAFFPRNFYNPVRWKLVRVKTWRALPTGKVVREKCVNSLSYIPVPPIPTTVTQWKLLWHSLKLVRLWLKINKIL